MYVLKICQIITPVFNQCESLGSNIGSKTLFAEQGKLGSYSACLITAFYRINLQQGKWLCFTLKSLWPNHTVFTTEFQECLRKGLFI